MKEKAINPLKDLVADQLAIWNIEGLTNHVLTAIILLILLIIVNYAFYYLIHYALKLPLKTFFKAEEDTFKHKLIKRGIGKNIASLIPLIISVNLIEVWFSDFPVASKWFSMLFKLLIVITFFSLLKNIARASKDLLENKPKYKGKPLESYRQVTIIILNIIMFLIMFSIITGIETWKFLGSLGAASAVLMLIFKDTILGFVASIQVSLNDIVKVGDWIEMPQFRVDGLVTEINLTTVKVQGSNRTITTVPTHKMVTESITNWSNVHVLKTRRIKRAINVSSDSVHFLSKKEIDNLKKEGLFVNPENSTINNGQINNLTAFRLYLLDYLKNHPEIRSDQNILVRMLSPDENGIPMEIFAYTTTSVWVIYERIMTELFEHVIAMVPKFDLRLVEIYSFGSKFSQKTNNE